MIIFQACKKKRGLPSPSSPFSIVLFEEYLCLALRRLRFLVVRNGDQCLRSADYTTSHRPVNLFPAAGASKQQKLVKQLISPCAIVTDSATARSEGQTAGTRPISRFGVSDNAFEDALSSDPD